MPRVSAAGSQNGWERKLVVPRNLVCVWVQNYVREQNVWMGAETSDGSRNCRMAENGSIMVKGEGGRICWGNCGQTKSESECPVRMKDRIPQNSFIKF